jgi:hypothetical protein
MGFASLSLPAVAEIPNPGSRIATPEMAGRVADEALRGSRGELRFSWNKPLTICPHAVLEDVLATGCNAVLYMPITLFLLIDVEFSDIHAEHFNVVVDKRLGLLMPHK